MATIDEERRKRLAIPSRSMQGQKPPTNMLSPTAVPPSPIRALNKPSPLDPYRQAAQEMGGGPRSAGAVLGTGFKRTLVDAPLELGQQVSNYAGWLYGGPAEFAKGLVGMRPENAAQGAAQPAQNIPSATQPSAPAQPVTQAATQPMAQPPIAQPGQVAQVPQEVQPGGGSIQWNAMGRGALDQLAPGQRDQFTRPGGMTITPDQASELAKRVQTVPAESFRRPMASTMEALSNARNAAMDRGDFNAVRRSYLSPEDLQAENEQIVEKRALSGRRQMLEARAREPISTNGSLSEMFTRVGNRKQAKAQLQQLEEQAAKSPGYAQQAFENQIAATNAQANVTRANAALNRPNVSVEKRRVVNPETGAEEDQLFLFDKNSGRLTPYAAELNPTAPQPAPPDRKQLVSGQPYTLKDGSVGVWDGDGFVIQ